MACTVRVGDRYLGPSYSTGMSNIELLSWLLKR